MPLISFDTKAPVYAMMTGGDNSVGAATTNLFQFASTFVASNGITRNSASRVTVPEDGFYELICNLSILVLGTSLTVSMQKGVNGVFTTEGTNPTASGICAFSSSYKFVFDLNKGDFVELRILVSGGAITTNLTRCMFGNSDTIYATNTIKKLR